MTNDQIEGDDDDIRSILADTELALAETLESNDDLIDEINDLKQDMLALDSEVADLTGRLEEAEYNEKQSADALAAILAIAERAV